ncbi:MAG: CBS domain-containing protein [Thermomonas sp.]|nr:CBS domain-containing protein [Thermomonas sp.]
MDETGKQWSAPRKAALVLDILGGRGEAAELARQAGVPLSQVDAWVDAARRGMEDALRSASPAGAANLHGDLRDLIRRPFADHDTVTVAPDDSLSHAWQRMRGEGISQLPVMEHDRIVGILDESDVLLHVYGDETRFGDPARAAMVQRLDKVDVKAPIEALLPVFDRGHVAIVMEGEGFLGLITRIDLLDHLRAKHG